MFLIKVYIWYFILMAVASMLWIVTWIVTDWQLESIAYVYLPKLSDAQDFIDFLIRAIPLDVEDVEFYNSLEEIRSTEEYLEWLDQQRSSKETIIALVKQDNEIISVVLLGEDNTILATIGNDCKHLKLVF